MEVNVKYDNAHYGDHETYDTTLADLLDTFNGIIDQDKLAANLLSEGIAIIHNGYATTTVTMPHTQYRECFCDGCSDTDWDAPNANCGLPQRDCCGCHDGYHTAGCLEETAEQDKLFWLARGNTERNLENLEASNGSN